MSRTRAADDFEFIRNRAAELDREKKAADETRAKQAQAEATALINDRANGPDTSPQNGSQPCGFLPPRFNLVRFEGPRWDSIYYFFDGKRWHGAFERRQSALAAALVIGAVKIKDLPLLLQGET